MTAPRTHTDWTGVAQAAALELLGEPARRTRREWRWGSHGSFRLVLDTGRWRDFEAGRGGGAIDLVEHLQEMDRTAALEWLRGRGHLDPRPPQNGPGAPESRFSKYNRPRLPQEPEMPPKTAPGATPWHLQAWARSQSIPSASEHPARRWMAARNLWRPEIPVPGVLRWEPPGRQHTGAGNILALIAPPAAWTAAWPGMPAIQALQRIAVDRGGAPALDRPADAGGLGKRSLGPTAGGIVVIGCPLLDEALDPVRVAEGVADTLALASRYPGPAVATVGTEGMRDGALAAWLATAPAGVVVHADADAGKDGRAPPGPAAARALCRAIEDAGGQARAVFAPAGKDAADTARERPFAPLEEGWLDFARTLRDTTDWPRWEIARQAANVFAEVDR